MEDEPSWAPLLWHHFNALDEEDNEFGELFERFNGPDEVFPHVLTLKEEGNSLFKFKHFNQASATYKKAIKFLCVAMSAIHEDASDLMNNSWFRDLILILSLNLAACSIKLSNFSEVVILCSLILEVDGGNVKALFRRGVAYINLGKPLNAYEDLNKARILEPNNKEIIKEFDYLGTIMGEGCKGEDVKENELGIVGQVNYASEQGMNSGSCDLMEECQGDYKVDVEVNQGSEVVTSAGKGLVEVNQGSEVDTSAGKGFVKVREESMKSCRLGEVVHKVERSEFNIEKEGGEKLPEKDSTVKKATKLGNRKPGDPRTRNAVQKPTFINRKRPNSFLRISMMDVEKLNQGKELQFFHPDSVSFLKVRTFIPKPTILTESPRNCVLREAEDPSSATDISKVVEDQAHSVNTFLFMEKDNDDQSNSLDRVSSISVENKQEGNCRPLYQDKVEDIQTMDCSRAKAKGDCSIFTDDSTVLAMECEEHYQVPSLEEGSIFIFKGERVLRNKYLRAATKLVSTSWRRAPPRSTGNSRIRIRKVFSMVTGRQAGLKRKYGAHPADLDCHIRKKLVIMYSCCICSTYVIQSHVMSPHDLAYKSSNVHVCGCQSHVMVSNESKYLVAQVPATGAGKGL